MTREEATKWLKTFKGRTGMAELSQAFDVAIKALEQEPQTDEIILSKKEYRELLSNEFEHGYDKGLSDAIKSLEQEPCNDAISRKEVTQSRPEWLSEDVERDTDEQTVVDRAFNRGWNSCLKEFLKNIKELPSVTPQQRVGKWIYDNHNWRCSECNKTPKTMGYVGTADFMAEHFKFCNHCGAKMERSDK